MESMSCCVCHKPVSEGAPRLGDRAYCPEHYSKVGLERRSVGRSGVLCIVAIVLLAALVALVAGLAEPELEGTALVLAGVILALVPSVLWLAFFYTQDRLEPEPKSYVIGVFVLGALLATAVGIPVVRNLFRVQDWMGRSVWANLLASILIIGFVQEFLKYAAVRFSVFPLPEFDELMDGILYGTAAGLGYATMLNINYVVQSGGVDLGMGVIRIAVTALAQASFAGITGYFLARSKFGVSAVWWLPVGLTSAALLNGVFSVLLGGVTRPGSVLGPSMSSPWYGLVLAVIVAGLTLSFLLLLIRRANSSLALASQAAAVLRPVGGNEI
jgi:RsiW-degrading membrane proteinase PrsW (M82 family)